MTLPYGRRAARSLLQPRRRAARDLLFLSPGVAARGILIRQSEQIRPSGKSAER